MRLSLAVFHRFGPVLVLLIVLALAQEDPLWLRLRSRYLGLKSLSGTFTETIYPQGADTAPTFQGRFFIRLPGSYRLEVTAPQKQLIVCQDSVIWFHFPNEKRAVRQSQGQSIPLLGFLTPFTDSTATVTIETTPQGRHLFTIKTQNPTVLSGLLLEVDQTGTRIDGFSFTDDWGNRYHFRLTSQQWNPAIPARIFIFKPPAGTEVEFQ